MRLTTIVFSHYNEKARWALDRFGVDYRELKLMPVLHFLPSMIASAGHGKSDGQSTRFSTPILHTDRGETLCDSTAIVRYVSDRFATDDTLYPTGTPTADERRFNETLAPATRVLAYYYLLPHRHLAMALARRNVGPLQVALFRVLFGVGRAFMQRRLKISTNSFDRATSTIRVMLAEVSARLADGRRFLDGPRFTATDLTFACAMAPALLVSRDEGFGAELPRIGEVPEELAVLVREFRQTPAGQFALRLFREERRVPARQKR